MSGASIVLPRPWTSKEMGNADPIKPPSEAAFVAEFGNVLPKAQYMPTAFGQAAYYSLPPSSPVPAGIKNPIQRVVFVHGVQTPAIGMQPLAKSLKARFPYAHCVLVDLWGHGLTATPIVCHDSESFLCLMDGLMMTLRWDDAHFIGYSFGGSTVATYAASEPKTVASMTLIAPAGLLRTSKLSEVEKGYMRGGNGVEDQAQKWILEYLEGGQLVVPSDWKDRVGRGEVVAEAVRDWQMKNHKGHAASVVGIFRDGGAFDNHANFTAASKTVKSLCVLGELDEVCSVQDLHEVGIESYRVVPKVGHAVVRERVPEVTAIIEDFWKNIERA